MSKIEFFENKIENEYKLFKKSLHNDIYESEILAKKLENESKTLPTEQKAELDSIVNELAHNNSFEMTKEELAALHDFFI